LIYDARDGRFGFLLGRGREKSWMSEGPPKDPTADERFQHRAAMAEVNGRRVNEAIEPRGPRGDTAVFVCECGSLPCGETVEIPVGEYESVRTDFDRFLVVPGHEIEEVDEVVERRAGYLVVVKREPEARAMARASDERTP
jgi:hypothetical protein